VIKMKGVVVGVKVGTVVGTVARGGGSSKGRVTKRVVQVAGERAALHASTSPLSICNRVARDAPISGAPGARDG